VPKVQEIQQATQGRGNPFDVGRVITSVGKGYSFPSEMGPDALPEKNVYYMQKRLNLVGAYFCHYFVHFCYLLTTARW